MNATTTLQRSRTRWSAESAPHRARPCRRTYFNGAALVGVRRANVFPIDPGGPPTSTEPHSLECGESFACSGPGPGWQTSTEPHSLECGEWNQAWHMSFQRITSTEPHSLECGEWRRHRDLERAGSDFNGAALVGVRRGRRSHRCAWPLANFNGAALVGVRRDDRQSHDRSDHQDHFNGAALVGVRRVQTSQAEPESKDHHFNGAALVGVRRGPCKKLLSVA